MRLSFVIAAAVVATACTGGESAPEIDPLEAAAAEKCPEVHLDRMDTDWIIESGDPKTRLRIARDGDAYKAYFVGGMFQAVELKGERREKDVRFVEVPSATRLEFEKKGQKKRRTLLFVEPSYRTCALNVFIGSLEEDVENVPPKPTEFLVFPKSGGVTFTYEPWTEPLFVGDAAKKKDVADKQLEETGAAKPDVEMGEAVPVGMWSKADEDGDAACTYDMDLYFDDKLMTEPAKVPAGKVEDGSRHWYHEWNAPYSGNHSFQIYRYRTCDGGQRELIARAGIEAILTQ